MSEHGTGGYAAPAGQMTDTYDGGRLARLLHGPSIPFAC
jgi:hypothetical protein